MRTAFLLRHAPILADLEDELLERVAGEVSQVAVPAGAWIMREGDPADSMFIVREGRIEVLHEGSPETLLRVLRRGDVLGELALLREGRRTASARALRDTELLKLGRAAFQRLIEQVPGFALGLTRGLGDQLAARRGPLASAISPRTIAVVGLDAAAPTAELGESLAAELAGHGDTARLRGGDLGTIDQAERDNRTVVLVASPSPDDRWTRLCLSEADVVLAVTGGVPDPIWMTQLPALRDCELMVLGPSAPSATLAALQPREVQVIAVPAARPAAMASTARRLSGRALGIVLSGGGARAFAHLGVLEELQAAGLHFDRLGGVSLGSLMAAMTALGLPSEEIYETCKRGFVETNPTRDFTVPAFSLIRGATTRRLLRDYFGERRIEELPRRFFCVSCDLVRREAVVHRTGPIVDAVYPSLAIPGVFPPVPDGHGRLLVDGGVVDNLPVATMARRGEGPVIAVDATGPVGQFKRPQRPRTARLRRPLRRALTGSEDPIPSLGETIVRTIAVGSSDTVAAARLHAEAVITPDVAGIGLMDWKAIDRVRRLGREAARRALDSDHELLARLGG
jgi:NTE family protein